MAQEKDLQTDILDDLRSFGKYCECFKIMKASDNGVPDVFFSLAICGPVLLEVKRPREEPSKLQYKKIEKLKQCGCKSTWVSSWEEWISLKCKLLICDRQLVADTHDKMGVILDRDLK